MDGETVPLAKLAERGAELVAIHGQGEQLRLVRPAVQRDLLDAFGAHDRQRDAVAAADHRLRDIQAERGALGGDPRERARRLALLEHEVNEIDDAAIGPAEDAELSSALAVARSAERLRASASSVYELLVGERAAARDRLAIAARDLAAAAELDPRLAEHATRLTASVDEVADLGAELRRYADAIDVDPRELARLEARNDALADLRRLLAVADLAAAMSTEALLGTDRAFAADLQQLRPHAGQAASAANLRRLLAGSAIVASHREGDSRVQDAYSIRCTPQVHGAARDTAAHAAAVAAVELRSAIDNPMILPDGRVESCGNFHGAPLGFACDFLAIAAAEVGAIAERRTDRLLDAGRSQGLPPFLAADPGVNSGLMIAHYTQAAMVAENRRLAAPASVDSLPTSAMQEDHVSMGWGAARKLRTTLGNLGRGLPPNVTLHDLLSLYARRHAAGEPEGGRGAALHPLPRRRG